MASRKSPAPTIRQYRSQDDRQIWALAALPAVLPPGEPMPPIPLPPAEAAPADFPDLAHIADRFVRAGGDFLVAELAGNVVGTAGLLLTDRWVAHVVRIFVHPAVRRQGIGTALLEAVEWRAEGLGVRQLRLDVGDDSAGAVAFYRAAGFRKLDDDDEVEQEWDVSLFSKALKLLP